MKTDSIPRITIVTVVLDDIEHIEATIQSVLDQTYRDIEYLVIDGGSSDGTLDVIKSYADRIDHWVSEPDDGIYDAMNKGLAAAHGRWVNFMNSGDRFADSDVLKSISSLLDLSYTIVSGKVLLSYLDDPVQYYGNSAIIPHQSAFFRLDDLKRLRFNTDFRIFADAELLHRLRQLEDFRSKYVDVTVCHFALGGMGNHPSFFFQRLREEARLKRVTKAAFSSKRGVMLVYDFLGLLLYKVFGERYYYMSYQKRLLDHLKKRDQG